VADTLENLVTVCDKCHQVLEWKITEMLFQLLINQHGMEAVQKGVAAVATKLKQQKSVEN